MNIWPVVDLIKKSLFIFILLFSISSAYGVDINDALKYHKRFKKYFPESDYTKESDNMVKTINKELEKFKSLNSK